MEKPDHLTCVLGNFYVGKEATARTLLGTTDEFKIGKEQDEAVYFHHLFNVNVEYLCNENPIKSIKGKMI